MHSQFSPDSQITMEKAAEACLLKGISGIVFTDHLDLETPTGDDKFVFDPAQQQRCADEVSLKYKLEILKGAELGLQPHTVEKTKDYIKQYSFDMIIVSVHFVDGIDPYHQRDFYLGKDHKEAYGRYLETILECIEGFGDFDVLGHYDYITRYAPYRERSVRYREFPDLLDTILTYLARNGKALEINTNTYRSKYGGALSPDPDIYKRFKELGGEFVSLGSDAHTLERICENFDMFCEFIRKCGFSHITHFKGRNPVLTRI
jgi:histidinol-phosphatase (PHP family)